METTKMRRRFLQLTYILVLCILLPLFLTQLSYTQTQTILTPSRGDYSAYYSAASDTSDAFTIKMPTSGGRAIVVTNFSIQCISATSTDKCTVEFQKGGTAATTTASTIVQVNERARVVTATVFSNSNAGAGTIMNKVDQPANVPLRYLSGLAMVVPGSQVTIRVSSTGAMEYRYYIDWVEP